MGFRKYLALMVFGALLFPLLAACSQGVEPVPEIVSGTTLIINYHRYDDEYRDWDLWVWPAGREGSGYPFTETTEFGFRAVITFEEVIARLGFIVRKGGSSWTAKDVNEDRFVDLPHGVVEVWLLQGDPTVYLSLEDVSISPRIQTAYMDSRDEILAVLTHPLTLNGRGDEGFKVLADGQELEISSVGDSVLRDPLRLGYSLLDEDSKVKFILVPGNHGFRHQDTKLAIYISAPGNDWGGTSAGDGKFSPLPHWRMTWNSGEGYWELIKNIGEGPGEVALESEFKFTLDSGSVQEWFPSSNIAVRNLNQGRETRFIRIALAQPAEVTANLILDHPDIMKREITKRGVLDLPEFFYPGRDLGNTWSVDTTKFRVWAPTASAISVAIYDRYDSKAPALEQPMKRDLNGTWLLDLPGDHKNRFYTYIVTVDGRTREATDPYARAVTVNGNKGQIIDLKETNPAGWGTQKVPPFTHREDAVIWEMHIRDFSIAANSGMENKGKYLAFTETGTTGPNGVKTGVDHLVELGITHIHLMPVYDFASIDERIGGYNWGYDPYHYNVPEGSYSTDPYDGRVRVNEFKQMVQSLHEKGIRVVMDVVYNHTYTTGDSIFDIIVPQYYYRTDQLGRYANGSGCGNEIASERPMVRKFIVDSVVYWATEYKIKGFRFDLMALHDIETMLAVEKALKAIDPTIIIYGEPWQAGGSPLDPSHQFGRGTQRGTMISVFNDNIRDAIKGDTDGTVRGFVQGAGGRLAIMRGVVGGIDYDSEIRDFTDQPGESVNYVSAHDNLTLFDKISKTNPNDSEETRIQMHKLANTIVFTSQGIAFLHGGVELLRTKGGDHNSYKSGDTVNQIDWERKSTYNDVFGYYQGLVELRRNHPAFRMRTADEVRNHLEFLESPEGTVAFILKDNANKDFWKNIVVIYNPHRQAVEFQLPQAGTWHVVVDGQRAGTQTLDTIQAGKVTVPAISALVLWKK